MNRNSLHTALLAAASLAVVALVGWRAGAEATEARIAPQPTTVAIVNVERAMNELTELADLNNALKTRIDARQAELDALKKQLEDTNAQVGILPESEVSKRLELVARLTELEEMRKAKLGIYERLIQVEQGEILHPLYTKFVEAVGEIATKQGYDLVLFDDRGIKVPRSAQEIVNRAIQTKRVLYAKDSLDITGEVILLMNEKYKTGAN